MKWQTLSEEEKTKEVYGKWTIQDFWTWWSNDKDKYMEVRIKDIDKIKFVAKKYDLPWSASGVYVNTADLLKKVITTLRNDTVMWFGVQHKKKNFNKYNMYKVFAGSDNHIESIKYLFIDIDRTKKETFATSEELEKCDILAEKIIEKFALQGWNKNYIKICSGHGVQIIFSLDISIMVPECDFIWKDRLFKYTEEFEKIKKILSKGIGKEIAQFANKYKEELGCDVDTSAFNIGRVAALPFTKNLKYGGKRWRGIIEMKNEGQNDGLTDYILSKKIVEDHKFSVLVKSNLIAYETRLHKGKMNENPLTRLLTENKLPHGKINNTLWLNYKCLCRDSKIDFNSNEFIEIHKQIEVMQKDNYPTNIPNENYEFSTDAINKFCLDYNIPTIYKLWPSRKIIKDYNIGKITYDMIYLTEDIMQLDGETYLKDFDQITKLMIEKNNRKLFASFLRGFKEKYGEEKLKFFIKERVFETYFCKGTK